MTQALFVDKSSSTFADALAAYGLALVVYEVLEKTVPRQKPTVRLSDQGGYYRIDCKPALDDDLLSRLPIPYAPGAPIIRTAKNAKKLPQNLPPAAFVEYEVERDKRAGYFEARKALSKEALRALNQGQDHPELNTLQGLSPHPDWDIFRAINPSALIGYNKLLASWWQIEAAQREVLMLLRDCFAQTPNAVDGAIEAWKALDKEHGWGIKPVTTALQLYNPAQGKGQNRTKADKLTMGNIKDAFWLLEWLKAVGFYESALTKQLRGVKDRKSYVLAPSEIDWKANTDIMRTFQESMNRSETAVRSDVLVALRYTQALLEYSQEGQNAIFQERMVRRGGPARVVSGFYSAFYKNLGNSAATMNLSFIGLPMWIHTRDAQDVRDALAILEEHEAIVRQFDESHSDDFDLLLNYRDFIAASDLWPFFRFTTAYSSYIISQRERSNGRARQLTVENLRRLIVSAEPKLSRILETPGFQNIAYAIRQSTVVAQYRKKQGDRRYDVRYGLNQELARKANYPGDFITALSDFMHRYNAENAQVMEKRSGPYRRSIQTSDVEDIVALVDEYGSQLVCNLLIAYGYAREPRPDNGQAEETEKSEG